MHKGVVFSLLINPRCVLGVAGVKSPIVISRSSQESGAPVSGTLLFKRQILRAGEVKSDAEMTHW